PHRPPTQLSTLSLHDALPICVSKLLSACGFPTILSGYTAYCSPKPLRFHFTEIHCLTPSRPYILSHRKPSRISGFSSGSDASALDRKSTRLNSSHVSISYAVF